MHARASDGLDARPGFGEHHTRLGGLPAAGSDPRSGVAELPLSAHFETLVVTGEMRAALAKEARLGQGVSKGIRSECAAMSAAEHGRVGAAYGIPSRRVSG